MSEKMTPGRDFALWSRMAKEDPEGFETMRLAAIEEFLESVPEQNRDRLRRLQWRIDQERRLAPSPMAACIRLSSMMWDQVLGKGGLRERLRGLDNPDGSDDTPEPSGNVVTLIRD